MNRHRLLVGGIFAVIALILIYCGYRYGGKWTGLSIDENFSWKTLWDWLDLVIIPILLVILGAVFTHLGNKANEATRDAAQMESQATRDVAEQRAMDDALQAYLDLMAQMLLDRDNPLRGSE